jgi:serine phosphatase RsbU (regulator of sigma subunit)
LENLVEERTTEVVHQKELVERKNREIIDSITYAKRIQRAILPKPKRLRNKLPKAFILFKPKDIVAGDFYWLEEKGDQMLLAVADCTGHGVPGAMVSLICNNTLSRTVREFDFTEPGEILDMVRDILIQSFASSHGMVQDGMDIALVSWNRQTNLLKFAGAHNDLHIMRNGEMIILRADRQPIGDFKNMKPFTTSTFQLQEGDCLYMFSDGYQDQFGGPKGKKFKSRQLLEKIKSIQHLSMVDQKLKLNAIFQEWKGDLEQVDDVCVLGVKI